MSKIKFITLLFLTASLGVCSQNSGTSSCKVYLEPIIGFDLSIGDMIEDVLKKIDNYQESKGAELRYTPKNAKVFTADKLIKLPNNYEAEVKLNLQLKEGLLTTYNLTFPIGRDYKYFWILIDYIKKRDEAKINAFIYDSGKKPSYTDLLNDAHCKRMLSVIRRYEDNTILDVSCNVN